VENIAEQERSQMTIWCMRIAFWIPKATYTLSGDVIIIALLLPQRQFHSDSARQLSAKQYDIYHCCVYNGKLLIMDRGTVRNM
jgi:hypothetical protein